MDLLTRKKLLMRKYNNPTFTIEELDFFAKINATEIIALLKENPLLRTSNKFFEHTHIHEMEKILASIFEPDSNFARSQIFNILVNLLRESTTVLQVCFKNQDFNYMSIFGFLQEQHIDYAILILLEDVLLPFIRKTPFQLIKIIGNDEYIEQLFLRRIYEKPIFKIIYTIMFCLSKRHSEQCKNQIRKIIRELVNTPFSYLLHRDKKIQQNISIIAQDKTEMKSPSKKQDDKETKYKYFDSESKQLFPPVHTKKVRQRKRASSDVSCEDVKSIQQGEFKGKKQSNGSTKKKSHQSTSSLELDFIMSQHWLEHDLHLHRSIPLHSNPHVHSLASLDQPIYKQIVFNEDLCYGDLTQNMKDLLTDIGLNIKYVYIKNVLMLLQNFNEEYVESLIANIRRYGGDEDYERYCYGAVDILYEFGQLYKEVVNYEKTIPRSSCERVSQGQFERSVNGRIGTISPSKVASNINEYQIELTSLITKLQKEIRIIAKKIPILANCLLQDNEHHMKFSSGQHVKKVTMAKYKTIQLICQLLTFNSKDNNDWYLDLTENINFKQINIYPVLNKYFKMTKWNSILHTSLTKLIKLMLQQNYQGFKQHCIINVSPQDSILGTLFELYRNKKYIHLATMKFTNYGNIHMIYNITTIIVQSLVKNNDYDLLIAKFREFDVFVHSDILGYEARIDAMSQWFDQKIMPRESQIIQNTVPCQDMNGKIISASLQNAQELMNQLENSKRWISFSQTRKQTL